MLIATILSVIRNGSDRVRMCGASRPFEGLENAYEIRMAKNHRNVVGWESTASWRCVHRIAHAVPARDRHAGRPPALPSGASTHRTGPGMTTSGTTMATWGRSGRRPADDELSRGSRSSERPAGDGRASSRHPCGHGICPAGINRSPLARSRCWRDRIDRYNCSRVGCVSPVHPWPIGSGTGSEGRLNEARPQRHLITPARIPPQAAGTSTVMWAWRWTSAPGSPPAIVRRSSAPCAWRQGVSSRCGFGELRRTRWCPRTVRPTSSWCPWRGR